jgi:hypothetical protein
MKNRMGFKSFIKDKSKIWDVYEEILKVEDNTFIDELDHLIIALVNELGVKKEKQVEKLKKELNNVKQRGLLNKNKKM